MLNWNDLRVGSTIHLPQGNFYVSTVELLGTERKPKGIGEVWDRNGFSLTRDSAIVTDLFDGYLNAHTPTMNCRPVRRGRVINAGDPDWPKITQYLFKGERGEHSYTQAELD